MEVIEFNKTWEHLDGSDRELCKWNIALKDEQKYNMEQVLNEQEPKMWVTLKDTLRGYSSKYAV